MTTDEMITLTRDCPGVLIPSGDNIKLVVGTKVKITQALGGDFTLFVNGNLVKISGQDADAIGLEPVEDPLANMEANEGDLVKEDIVWTQLRTCYDPEIPVNIVDLGLIYELNIEPISKGSWVHIKMTLTAPGCGMGPIIAQDAEDKIRAIPGVSDVLVEIVWDPLWSRDMMSEEARLQLGLL